jgi:hypothetical protein
MSKNGIRITRRALLKNAALPAAGAVILPQTGWAQKSAQTPIHLPVLSQPDLTFAFVGEVEAVRYNLSRAGNAWTGSGTAAGVRVDFLPGPQQSKVSLESPTC